MNRREDLKKGKMIADRWWYDNKSTGNQQTQGMAGDQMRIRQKNKRVSILQTCFLLSGLSLHITS